MSQEEENVVFEGMQAKYGAYGLEEKIQKRELARKYYRRWPYDAWSKRTGMDAVDLVMPSTPLQDVIEAEAHAALLAGLTPRELEVALWSEAGFKPREMAEMRAIKAGEPPDMATSNADRWMKHRVKERFTEKLS